MSNTGTPTRDEPFDRAYAAGAALGICDSPGGVEYRRVRREWIKAGRPVEIHGFIRRRANAGPAGPQRGFVVDTGPRVGA